MPIALSVRFFDHAKVRLILMQWSCVAKYCHMNTFSNFFFLFCVPPMPTSPAAPIHTDLCPSAPILDIFCLPSQNIMSGEISPDIWAKTMYCVPVYAHTYLVFLPARTHIPIAPIRTHLHAFTLVHTLNYNVYMYYLQYNWIGKRCPKL